MSLSPCSDATDVFGPAKDRKHANENQGLESLPTELQRNFNLMRDLDQRAQDLMKEIDVAADEYLTNVRGMSSEKRTEQLGSIQKLFGKSREFGDDKVQLAMQTYEMVDKHIRKLDADLARFEADLKDKSLSQPKNENIESTGKKGGLKDKDKKKRKFNKDEFEDEIPRKKKKKGQQIQEEAPPPPVAVLPLSITNPSDVLDMPVDPNEPTYCLCHQVSYGEMIGCDNPDCPIEWFHFGCVGFTSKPKGKWYCPRCTEERKKKKCPIEWFHFACVGLTTKPKGKWYCPRCQEERKKK